MKIYENLFCYGCEEHVEITPDDVEVLYTLKLPFVDGQQISQTSEFSAVAPEDTLTQLLKNGKLDLNAQLYNPSNEEYHLTHVI